MCLQRRTSSSAGCDYKSIFRAVCLRGYARQNWRGQFKEQGCLQRKMFPHFQSPDAKGTVGGGGKSSRPEPRDLCEGNPGKWSQPFPRQEKATSPSVRDGSGPGP